LTHKQHDLVVAATGAAFLDGVHACIIETAAAVGPKGAKAGDAFLQATKAFRDAFVDHTSALKISPHVAAVVKGSRLEDGVAL